MMFSNEELKSSQPISTSQASKKFQQINSNYILAKSLKTKMAEAVLELALQNLGSLIKNKLGLFLGVDQAKKRLSSTLATIQAVLEDAEEKQLTDTAIKNWLQKLKDAAHVLVDILDECETEALQLECQGLKSGFANKVRRSCFSSISPKHVLFRHKIAKKIKRISETLDEIAEERKFHLQETVIDRRAEIMEWRQTSSIMTQPEVYGREEEKEKIVDFLVGHASNVENVSVYPIVGIGGLGKTTLAQLIFKDERVVKHFELRIWVCVSEDFSLKRMSKAIIEAASGCACEDLDLEPLQKRLQQLVEGKRYLLVLDDVWNDDQEKWDRLKYILTCGSMGASILVTTRLKKVASIMETRSSHQLSILSEDACWALFKHRAFGPDNREHEELVAIGKEIVKKCGGVPLAAKALGSLLRFRSEEREWLKVKESKLWSLPQKENSIMPALKLSYLNLPVKLRQCFAYCAIFRKDDEISKHFLLQLWVANGFISSNDKLEVENDGEEVWNELYWRSFFQDIKTDIFGNISFKMHDLVHDLAQFVAGEVCCITDDNGSNNLSETTRHLSIYNYQLPKKCDLLQWSQVKSLKTFLAPYWGDYHDKSDLLRCYSLRVLDFTHLRKLPSSISQLKHLRYLNLSHGFFKTLPKSIGSLWNLQVLNLEHCDQLQRLPNNLTCLRALRHLYLRGCMSLSSLPPHMGQLTLLRTLSKYFVDKKSGFLLEELGHLNLKGELHIKHLERISSVAEARKANMVGKHLNDLRLSWNRNGESELQGNVEQILEVLEPHPQHLQALRVGGYRGVNFPQWMGSATLEHLEFLQLVDCINCVQLPPLGKLPSLKGLIVSNTNLVRYVDEESYIGGAVGGFKALEFLILDKLPNLEKLSKELGEDIFPRLSKLKISNCPKLALPRLPSLSELYITENCSYELQHLISFLNGLEFLEFNHDKESSSLPDGMLRNHTSSKLLRIEECDKLKALPTETTNLNAFENLIVISCNSLETFAEQVWQGLHSLKNLEILWCQKFKVSDGLQYLTALEHLQLVSCPEVEGFSEALQHLTSLQSLMLSDLPNLVLLPDCFGNLKDLESLGIFECPKLVSLPLSIKGLSSLKYLNIDSCPELSKRCKKEVGEDWDKIVHVPSIIVDMDYIG